MTNSFADNWKENLDELFQPKSVAIIGASQSEGSRGFAIMSSLLKSGYRGRIFPVNPKYSEIAGVRCYKSVNEVGEPIDFAMIMIPNTLVPQTLDQCAKVGVKAGVVVTAGFGEALRYPEGKSLEARLKETCEKHEIRLCGPNCIGVINTQANFIAYGAIRSPTVQAGNVALIMQSGTMGISMSEIMCERGIGYSHLITSGNEAVLNMSDYISYLIERPEVKVVGAFIEGLKNPQKFVTACKRALELRKPIIVLKVGRSENGAKIASSHTGSISGEYQIFEGISRQNGVVLTKTVEEFVETLVLFSGASIDRNYLGPKGPAFLSMSGGTSSLIGDLSQENGVELADLTTQTVESLCKLLPAYATPSNPLDATGVEVQETMPKLFATVAEDPFVNALVYVTPSLKTDWDLGVPRKLVTSADTLGKPLIFLCQNCGNINKKVATTLGSHPVLEGLLPALLAIKNLSWYSKRMFPEREETIACFSYLEEMPT